jgi:hypothetical protein
MPVCISFRDAPLEHEEQMRIMFDAISVTNETSIVPSTNGGECEDADAADGVDNNEGQEEEQPPIIPNGKPTSAKRAGTSSPKGKKKKTFRDQCMKRLVDAYPNRNRFLAPYKGQRYHISKWEHHQPVGLKEVFNKSHSSLRNVIERSFRVLKMKW